MWDSGQSMVTPASSGTTSRLPAQLGGVKSPSPTPAMGRTFHKAWKISLRPALSTEWYVTWEWDGARGMSPPAAVLEAPLGPPSTPWALVPNAHRTKLGPHG